MKIALIGYGKMGKTIDQLAQAAGHQVVARIDVGNQGDLSAESLTSADVAIEFTRPESAFNNIVTCLENGVPVVSGTTGWLDRLEEAKQLVEKYQGGLFYASNYSIGVNIFFAINKQLAKLMKRYDQYGISMEEIHHTQKLDAPSGTAITLAEGILGELSYKKSWVNEPSQQDEELPIISKRIDKVPGTHTIRYNSPIDNITITHTAHSREGFARGALAAAEWMVGKQGFYGMEDMLS
ncbi:MAG: 4-hydroxy-tetrahydrodipicolinate reductase [Saprospiraceae bacterium]|nr:4-hydroxy-tetrahydrodipicolinate reductase [Saprospiraceae bacterium]